MSKPVFTNEQFERQCEAFIDAKAKRAALDLVLSELESGLIGMVEQKDSGTSKHSTPRFDLQVQFKQEHKIANVGELASRLDEAAFKAVTRVKYEVDVRAMKKFAEDPAYAQIINELIEVKDQKPWVQVKPVTA